MKRFAYLACLVLLCVVVLGGCSDNDASSNMTRDPGDTGDAAGTAQLVLTWNDIDDALDLHADTPGSDEVIDFTILSDTILNVEITNMQIEPENYWGKIFIFEGEYGNTVLERTGLEHDYILIEDITGCCQQELELVWSSKNGSPADKPSSGQQIEVTGTYASYTLQDSTFNCILVTSYEEIA